MLESHNKVIHIQMSWHSGANCHHLLMKLDEFRTFEILWVIFNRKCWPPDCEVASHGGQMEPQNQICCMDVQPLVKGWSAWMPYGLDVSRCPKTP